ncbi:MAG: hypothetical protein EA376_02105 [Phycisphaeraceae bacterium]|nr:MAG: hypothetical protein EA376_02105 [Phycisphaeraceae bacterium]
MTAGAAWPAPARYAGVMKQSRPSAWRAPIVWALPILLSLFAAQVSAKVVFRVGFEDDLRQRPVAGRVIVFVILEGEHPQASPADAPFFSQPQPMFGVDTRRLAPGETIVVDDGATSFPAPPSALPPGTHRAQAVFRTNRVNSSWRREPGNMVSQVVEFTVPESSEDGATVEVELPLTSVIVDGPPPVVDGVEIFDIRSEILSSHRRSDVKLRAGVVFPIDHDPGRSYPALYIIPGFGGDHTTAFAERRRRENPGADADETELRRNAFLIYLDPESPNGHHLFANSENNGPVGDALVMELLPALEQRYDLIPRASARMLRGHSSGGWSTVWLALTRPETFGACWSSAPDPVDFRAFQLVNIYEDANMFFDAEAGEEIPSYRRGGEVRMTIREENRMEEVMGPDNTSSQQWDSWLAVFGPRNERGNPAALYNPDTGEIDHALAEQFRTFDIGHLVRTDPARYGRTLRRSVRIICGDEDGYYLEKAVMLLKQDAIRLGILDERGESDGGGYITLVPGADHGSVLRSEEALRFPGEMLEHLRRAGHLRE